MKLKDVAEINPRKSEIDKDTVEQVSFVAMADVSEEGFISDHETRPLSKVYGGYTYFKKGDVLLAKITPCFENGKAAIADNIPNDIGFGSSEFHVLRTNGEVLSKYLFYALWNKPFREHGSKKMTGSAGQKRIPTNFLKNFEIPLPSLSEQKTIVAKLDRAQRLIDIDKEMLAKYDELIQSVFLEMFGDPVTNPKGWDRTLIKNLAEDSKYSIKAGPFGSALKKEFYVEDGYKIYGQEQVIRDDFEYGDYYIDEKRFEKLKNCEIKKDDVLISLVGSYGYISVVPNGIKRGIINPRLMKISFDKNKILPFFFKSLFTNESFEKLIKDQTHGGTMGILNTTIVKKLNIPVPPIYLQKSFLDKLRSIRREMSENEKSLNKTEDLFSSLVQGAFG